MGQAGLGADQTVHDRRGDEDVCGHGDTEPPDEVWCQLVVEYEGHGDLQGTMRRESRREMSWPYPTRKMIVETSLGVRWGGVGWGGVGWLETHEPRMQMPMVRGTRTWRLQRRKAR